MRTRILRSWIVAACFSVAAPALAGTLPVSWAPSMDQLTAGYDVEVLDEHGDVLQIVDAGASTRVTIEGLDDGVYYLVRIRPYDDHGERARRASKPLRTMPAPRIEALEAPVIPGSPVTATLIGANFDAGARVVATRDALTVRDARIASTSKATVTIVWDGHGEAPSPADLAVVNPVRRSERFLERHDELLDVDGSGSLDEADVALVREAFGAREGAARYVARLDVNGDGAIDGEDLASLRARVADGATEDDPAAGDGR